MRDDESDLQLSAYIINKIAIEFVIKNIELYI